MAKFKVGDKVRVKPYSYAFPYIGIPKPSLERIAGNIYTITGHRDGTVTKQWYVLAETSYSLAEEMFELAEQPRREFIVIRRSGAETIAELRHDREVIKSAKATCAPSDTFDLDTGAKLAFDRLMGREAKPITGKSFNRIFVDDIAPHPAPEQKFYTGKVAALPKEGVQHIGAMKVRNRVFDFVNGSCDAVQAEYLVKLPKFESIEHLRKELDGSRWIEIKE